MRRVAHLVMIGRPANIMAECIAAPCPVRANVAESKPPRDEAK
jgi:hypothetical protein